ncbi:MAG: UDP-3-O-(3-hydroxymyristoyl)glucosamine N-acyltransferase [Maricaulaceae bacterium]
MVDRQFFDYHGPIELGDLIAGLSCSVSQTHSSGTLIEGSAGLASSLSGDISFIDNRRHLKALDTAKASACFVTERLAEKINEKGIIPIVTAAPKASFGRALTKLFTQHPLGNGQNAKISATAKVHSSAVIGDNAVIGERVVIGPNVVVGAGVKIGDRSRLMNGVTLECAVIGSDCLIKPGATIGTVGFGISGDEMGLVEIPHIGRAILGDRVRIGSNSSVDRGLLQDTILEDDVKLDNLVQIGHNVRVGARTMMASFVGIPGSCNIGSDVIIGGQAGLADHLTVGDGAKIAGHSGIMHNVPAGEIWSGYPGMPVRNHMRVVSELIKMGKAKKRTEKDNDGA